MHILVRCEDSHGSYDIIKNAFTELELVSEEGFAERYKSKEHNITILRALGSDGVLEYDTYCANADIVIFSFDMDHWNITKTKEIENESFILLPEVLYFKIEEFKREFKSRVYFAPTVFCIETILLYKHDLGGGDFSKFFSRNYTAHLHIKMLFDLIHTKYEGEPYWKIRKTWKKLDLKHTELFIGGYPSIKELANELLKREYSEYDIPYLKWIEGKTIVENIDNLLDSSQMVDMQRKYVAEYKQFIESEKSYINYNGITYDLYKRYKPKDIGKIYTGISTV